MSSQRGLNEQSEGTQKALRASKSEHSEHQIKVNTVGAYKYYYK